MNSRIAVVLAAAISVIVAACAGTAPGASAPTTAAPTSGASAPASVVTTSLPSVAANPTPPVDRFTVAGSTEAGSAITYTVTLPAGWSSIQGFGAVRDTSEPPSGMAFLVSLVANVYADPCNHGEAMPKVGPSADDLAVALAKLPNLTATAPTKTTIAGRDATYLELTAPATLPCLAGQHYYVWQDTPPDSDWWLQGGTEVLKVWITEVRGQRVMIAAHTYPTSPPAAAGELQSIFASMAFDEAS